MKPHPDFEPALGHVAKGRMNRPLTETDIAELERMLIEEGCRSPEDLGRGREQCQKSGSFRAIAPRVGPWRPQGSFFGIPGGPALLPNQIAFLDMLINHLTEHGIVEAERP